MSVNARSLTAGIVAGLAGGVVFGIMMTTMGMMTMVAGLAGTSSVGVGWVVHLAIAAAFGFGFAILLGSAVTSAGRGAGLGALYGIGAWVVGALLIMPAMMGMPVFAIGEPQIMSLIGHAVYGVVAGLVFQRLATSTAAQELDRV